MKFRISPKLSCLFFIFPIVIQFFAAFANTDQNTNEFKILKNPVEIVNVTSIRAESGVRNFQLMVKIAEDHFLYTDDLEVISELEGLNNSSFLVSASPVIEFKDKFSNGEIKKGMKSEGKIEFTVPMGFNYNSKFKLKYRACTEEFCYLHKYIIFDHQQLSADESKKSSNIFNLNIDFENTSVVWILVLVFFAGVLTSFTPCIFPIIPITLTLIKNNSSLGRYQSFFKTLIFVFGIALTYAILGLAAATTGTFFGSLLSNIYVLIGISLIYFAMALSMFGFFELQFFSKLQNKFSKISTQSNLGIFSFGMITGIFASPCVGPVLVAVLTYAAQTKNLIFSFFLLFTYALGLGLIFLILSLFSNLIDRLPKSGNWLNGIKYTLGSLLIIAGIYFLIPAFKGLTTNNVVNYTQDLNEALKQKKIVIVDFKADWCGACKELELKTFSDPKIKDFLDKNIFIPIDVTVTNDDTNELLQKYGVIGLPHVMFFDQEGNLLPELTISSYITAEEMLTRIQKIPQN